MKTGIFAAFTLLWSSIQADVLTKEDFKRAKDLKAAGKLPDVKGKIDHGDILIQSQYRNLDDQLDQIEGKGPNARGAGFFGSAARNNYRWSGGEIPFQVSSEYSAIQKAKIAEAIDELQEKTCLRFVAASKWKFWQQRVWFTPENGADRCSSYVGNQYWAPWWQPVNLGANCMVKHIIQHELLHMLGFIHEHNRYDRNDYVSINFDNVAKGLKNQFYKYRSLRKSHEGSRYDYASIMHYADREFSKDSTLKTIIALKPLPPGVSLGMDALSEEDVKRVNRFYQCT